LQDGKLEIAAGSSVWVFKTQANDTLVLEDARKCLEPPMNGSKTTREGIPARE
jgi:hypothetical protein